MSTEQIDTRQATEILGIHRSTLAELAAGPLAPAVASRRPTRYHRAAIEVAATLRTEPESPETITLREALKLLGFDRSTLSPLIQPGAPLECIVAGRGPGRRLRFWRVGVEVVALASSRYRGIYWATGR